MFGLIEDKKYNVWYKTPRRERTKRKSFDTMEEVIKWCKANKNKVRLHSGSIYVLDTMREIQSNN